MLRTPGVKSLQGSVCRRAWARAAGRLIYLVLTPTPTGNNTVG